MGNEQALTLGADANRETFRRVFDTHFDRVYDFIARVEGSVELAEEVTAGVFEQFQSDLYGGGIYFRRRDLRLHLYRTAVSFPEPQREVTRDLFLGFEPFDRSTRQILALRYCVDLTDEEIAAVTGKKPDEISAIIEDVKKRMGVEGGQPTTP